jgi:outer membrane immunogenic protein
MLAALSTAALAADMPARTYTKAPMASPMFNWTGFYAGIHGGYGWADLGGAGPGNMDGFFGGGQLGVNYQGVGSPFVFGVEVDGAFADFDDSTAGFNSRVRGLASARGRIGYSWDRTMLYATGGFGWADTRLNGVSNDHTGYTLGGGIEYAFAGPWSAKLEYIHYGLGDETYAGVSRDLDVDTVKLGLNYRFGSGRWW